MHIVLVEIENFRGIESMTWVPRLGINCLIGPGDSTKTTILDAIEWALNPRSSFLADDYDFYDLKVDKGICITVSIGGLPIEFKAESKYGLHLRGWSTADSAIRDEPSEGLEDILSVRVAVDQSLEAHWSLYNKRIEESESDPPMIRYKDMKLLATSRLGPYAERHLGWGRQSVLGQLDESSENVSLRLAEASRAARNAFQSSGQEVFKATAARAQELSKDFSVPVRDKYRAELDIQSVAVSAGGIALHDKGLPLRRLGTGSSRLLVSALQRDAATTSHVALIDEIEHGLEPHRIARLLSYLKTSMKKGNQTRTAQIFLTTHSPVVILELTANEIFTVRSKDGITTATSMATASLDINTTQAHLRTSPEAFLARRIVVGEGKTECGFARGLDAWWAGKGKASFAFEGVVAINGGGKDNAPKIAETLLDLGYGVALLLDSDEEPNATTLDRARRKGGAIIQWKGRCSTEERVFLDLTWEGVVRLVRCAEAFLGTDSILAHVRNTCIQKGLPEVTDLGLPMDPDPGEFREVLGFSAKKYNWFKDIGRAEMIAGIIGDYLQAIESTPLATDIKRLRQWIDGQ
jgi:putative ATP-dependent endonuclease of OLD family